jgi:hypothetical protein
VSENQIQYTAPSGRTWTITVEKSQVSDSGEKYHPLTITDGRGNTYEDCMLVLMGPEPYITFSGVKQFENLTAIGMSVDVDTAKRINAMKELIG